VIVVDSEPSETSRAADLFVRCDPDRQMETLEVLRAIVRGVAIDPDRASRSSGIPFAELENLALRLQSAHYGALFFEPATCSGPRAIEALLKLIRDLNEGRRFVALELGSTGNASGAASVLAWQSGSPSAVDYGSEFPRHLPGEATLSARLSSGMVDAALIVGRSGPSQLDASTLDRLSQIPTIWIGPGMTRPEKTSVTFRVAQTGIESGGTVARVDGVMLPLRPALKSSLPTDRQVLEMIDQRRKSRATASQ
jgi:formylmethanofuran dehydrogenase subunit B